MDQVTKIKSGTANSSFFNLVFINSSLSLKKTEHPGHTYNFNSNRRFGVVYRWFCDKRGTVASIYRVKLRIS